MSNFNKITIADLYDLVRTQGGTWEIKSAPLENVEDYSKVALKGTIAEILPESDAFVNWFIALTNGIEGSFDGDDYVSARRIAKPATIRTA